MVNSICGDAVAERTDAIDGEDGHQEIRGDLQSGKLAAAAAAAARKIMACSLFRLFSTELMPSNTWSFNPRWQSLFIGAA